MKKLCLFICLSLITAVFVSAQPPNETKRDTFAPDWEEFSIENSKVFTPYHQYQNVNEKNAIRRYKTISGDGYVNHRTYFFIFSEPLQNTAQNDQVFEFIKYSEATGKTIKVNDFPANKYKFLGKDGFYHTILAVKTRNRAYIFQTTSEMEQNPESDNFFAGIRLHDQNIPPKPDGQGYGTGTGSGNGSSTNCRGDGDPTVVHTPLIILSKPEAKYSDFARFYEITGSVGINIIYLENGELGEVKTLWKLPFGLTENAFEAAKSIKFKPPTANGRPYTMNRTEEYLFTLETSLK